MHEEITNDKLQNSMPGRAKRVLLLIFLLHSVCFAGGAPVSFTRDLAPILSNKCFECHQAKKAKGHYRVDSFEAVLKAGDSKEKPLTAGKPDESAFFKRLITDDEDDRMPQKDDALPAAQIELFKRWIAEGAKFDGEDVRMPLADLMQKKEAPKAPEIYPQPLPVTALALLNDGKTLCTSGYHELLLWDVGPSKLLRRIAGMPERVLALSVHRDGKMLAVAGGTPSKVGEVVIVEAASGKVLKKLPNTKDTILAAAFSPDGSTLVVGGADNMLRAFRSSDWKQIWKSEAHADWITSLAFSHDSQRLVSTSRDRGARVFRAKDGEITHTFTGHQSAVQCAAFGEKDDVVVSASFDGEVRRWSSVPKDEIPQGEKEHNDLYKSRRQEVTNLCVADGKLYTASADGRVRWYDLKKSNDPPEIMNLGTRIDSLTLDDTGELLVLGGHNGEVRLFDLHDMKQVKSFKASPGW